MVGHHAKSCQMFYLYVDWYKRGDSVCYKNLSLGVLSTFREGLTQKFYRLPWWVAIPNLVGIWQGGKCLTTKQLS